MTRNVDEVRYPHSAELFRFCKEALNIKHQFEVKVIDQHVGSLLGFDPADCSHWKKGKKNIKSVQYTTAIAEQLGIDPKIIVDLSCGKIDYQHAIQEFKGYGNFSLSERFSDDAKREFFKNPGRFNEGLQPKTLDKLTDIARDEIIRITKQILMSARVNAAPVFLPEILAMCPNISVETCAQKDDVSIKYLAENSFVIVIPENQSSPEKRFLIAKNVGKIMLYPHGVSSEFEEIVDLRTNLFALHLLMPDQLIQIMASQADPTRDLMQQFSELFWVTRSIVNARMKEYFNNL